MRDQVYCEMIQAKALTSAGPQKSLLCLVTHKGLWGSQPVCHDLRKSRYFSIPCTDTLENDQSTTWGRARERGLLIALSEDSSFLQCPLCSGALGLCRELVQGSDLRQRPWLSTVVILTSPHSSAIDCYSCDLCVLNLYWDRWVVWPPISVAGASWLINMITISADQTILMTAAATIMPSSPAHNVYVPLPLWNAITHPHWN